MLPLRDTAGTLHSLQFIDTSGEKRFLSGGRKQGCYFAIGKPDGVLCLAEGLATAACVHQATGYAVAVAFDAGNLVPVAVALRAKYPDLRIAVCADDDYQTDGNPGRTKAAEAARAVGGVVAVPDFSADRPDGATDLNDLHLACGLDAVRACVDAAVSPDEADPSDGPSRCDYGGGYFECSRHGVFFVASDKEGNPQPPQWICSPLTVVAKTRDARGREWGRLLRWSDADGKPHEWAMPLELLQGDGTEVRCELARQGVEISPARMARERLTAFLNVWPVEGRARCVDRLGWHGDLYVTPSASFGNGTEITVFQNAHAIEPAFSVSGTVDQWRDSVAALAKGNSRLVFAVSVPFAPELLELIGEESGGFHGRGASSTGKTTMLKVSASVWGHPSQYPRLWRATTNGLEGLAALHNDGLLILDELSQIDPREAGEAAFLLANGQGKTRASRTGTARQAARWRLLFLSAGEESLTALMARVGRRASAGQEIRLADFDADAGAGLGVFEELHGLESPASFALALTDAAARAHGAVGVAWLHHLVADRHALPDVITDGMKQFVAEATPADAEGQVVRVARRFALVAVAGELATHYGLTGWPDGEASQAARRCFTAWLEGFGGAGNREDRAMRSQVRKFFEAHGSSRFESMASSCDQRVPNRAGFVRSEGAAREYLVLPEIYKQEVCQGFDPRRVTSALLQAGWLERAEDGKATQKIRLPNMGQHPTRCYVFTARMWEGDE